MLNLHTIDSFPPEDTSEQDNGEQKIGGTDGDISGSSDSDDGSLIIKGLQKLGLTAAEVEEFAKDTKKRLREKLNAKGGKRRKIEVVGKKIEIGRELEDDEPSSSSNAGTRVPSEEEGPSTEKTHAANPFLPLMFPVGMSGDTATGAGAVTNTEESETLLIGDLDVTASEFFNML